MLWRAFHRHASTATASRPKTFTFPQRINRSPTALLESLNACVQTDGGSPGYIYVDDPFLIPTSAHEKRQLALSKSSGKKAAQWIMNRYSYAFFHDVAAPSIPSYFPNYTFDEKEFIEPDETTLYKLMNWNKIIKAHEIYKKCLEQNVNVSDPCKYALFDLLCIYNSDNPMEMLSPEEDWYRRELNESNQAGSAQRTWKENGLAEQMFEELKLSATPEQKTRLYNSFACGLFKYNHAEKAILVIDEMKQNNIQLDLTTYNFLLHSASFIRETYEIRWQFMIEHLNEMKKNLIKPNLRTFNAILYTLRRCSLFERGPTLALSVLNEMRKNGIEPSLGTWAHVIMIFYPNDHIGYETQILPQIMDELEKQYELNGKNFEWRDIDDREFFFNAMFKASVNCRDVELAKRIHRFQMTGSNSRFIPDGFKEQMYYTNLFRLLFRFDIPEHVMPLWESVVPNIYSPSINIIEDLIEFISTWNLKDNYVRLWSDLLLLGFIDNRQNNRRIIERYLNLLIRSDQDSLPIEQIKQYANIGRQILKKFPLVPEQDERQQQQSDESQKEDNEAQQRAKQFRQLLPKFQYTGHILSNLIYLLTRADDFEASWSLYEHYLGNKSTLINPLNENSLMSLLSLSIKQNHVDQALNIIETINELNYECLSSALDLLNRHGNLDTKDRQRLRTIQKNSSLESAHLVKLV
ncbi:unnamed protein product [Rotaria magnacalcarata]|uniref:Small ribosomal subunit protein mS39 n=4 Tax=Rotaria magnacalcarata TaxID=392030 RepID=A0A815ETH8_9BILA|nr:unnamed protein product [Rotaria magnacalcarata]CAF1315933.1 unnamed protein product [Rotaria magnacalcarata]CAF2200836.1 unnamed protein product [Rotaria magnacalcarata]CAF2200978.1 unnamed protein product [Rotaria magnacalcarata]CAF2255973.1 unnamed protein product [Rotaria magnacalcarata]